MRVVLVSTHVDQTTGYSKVAYNLLRQIGTLQPAVKLFHYGFQRHPARANIRKAPAGVVTYDATANEEPRAEGFNYTGLKEYLETVNPQLVIFYNDPLVIGRFLTTLQYKKGVSPYAVWTYVDQLYPGIAQDLMDIIDNASDNVYCFTEKWRDIYKSYFPGGCKAKVKVMGHAADPDVFKPLAQRSAIRADLRIPEDAIVFFNCNRNSERKRLDLTIQGFVGLLKKNPKAPYYLLFATGSNLQTGAFYDLRRIFLSEVISNGLDLADVADRLLVVDTSGQTVYTDDAINRLYNASDIGINTSDGEGFGLCQLEHMQTGAPQIVTSVGSYEFLEGASITVPTKVRLYQGQTMVLGLFGSVPLSEDVTKGMAEAIEKLPQFREAIAMKAFPSWADTCSEFLEDLLLASKASS
jgi:glycosyltransferase involved in cell wall biosynthesis